MIKTNEEVSISIENNKNFNKKQIQKWKRNIFIWQVVLSAGIFLFRINQGPLVAIAFGEAISYKYIAWMLFGKFIGQTFITSWSNHHLRSDLAFKICGGLYIFYFASFVYAIYNKSITALILSIIFMTLTYVASIARNETYRYVGLRDHHIYMFIYIAYTFGFLLYFVLGQHLAFYTAIFLPTISIFLDYPKFYIHKYIEDTGGTAPKYYLLVIAIISFIGSYAQKLSLVKESNYTILFFIIISLLVIQKFRDKYKLIDYFIGIIWLILVMLSFLGIRNIAIYYVLQQLTGILILHFNFKGRWYKFINANAVAFLTGFIVWQFL